MLVFVQQSWTLYIEELVLRQGTSDQTCYLMLGSELLNEIADEFVKIKKIDKKNIKKKT